MRLIPPGYTLYLPSKVRFDKGLTAEEILLFGEIAGSCSQHKVCDYTNEQLATLTNCSLATVRRRILTLEAKKYIKVVQDKSGNKRHLYVTLKIPEKDIFK